MDTGLKDKIVLITGASGGIGSATARAFAEEGAKLILHGRSNMKTIKQLQKELLVESLAVQANLTREREVQNLFEKASRKFERIDILICTAGIWADEHIPIHTMSLEQWNHTILSDGTSVIVGSTAAVFGEEGHADYATAKAGVTYGLTLSLKNEIIRYITYFNFLYIRFIIIPITIQIVPNSIALILR